MHSDTKPGELQRVSSKFGCEFLSRLHHVRLTQDTKHTVYSNVSKNAFCDSQTFFFMNGIQQLNLTIYDGQSESPRMSALHCNGRRYVNAYATTFKVGFLRTYTLAQSILPLLEAPVKVFF
jgi:hypothetical protein